MRSLPTNSVLFSGLDEDEVRLVEQAGHPLDIDQGQFVFFQDDPGDRFFLVVSGKIKVYKISPEGKEQILLIASPGDTFGEAALFARRVYPATAEAVEPSRLLAFSRDAFLGLITRHPALAMNMIFRLSTLLHHLTHLVQQLSLEDVTTRLAGYLIGLIEEAEAATPLTLAEKKMVLASVLGTIPETLSRAFAKLTRLGIIAVDGQQIAILDRKKLEQIASGQKI